MRITIILLAVFLAACSKEEKEPAPIGACIDRALQAVPKGFDILGVPMWEDGERHPRTGFVRIHTEFNGKFDPLVYLCYWSDGTVRVRREIAGDR